MTGDEAAGGLTALLAGVRASRRARVAAVLAGVAAGSLLGSLHWTGIFAGGAVAGLGQRSTPRGVGAGALAGVGVWLVFLATLGAPGAVALLGATPVVYVSAGIAVGYGALGGLLRGVA